MNLAQFNCDIREKMPTAWACSFSYGALLCAASLPLLSMLHPSPVSAQTAQSSSTTAPSSPPPPPACASADHRAFDFWIGEWDVTPAGKKAPMAVNRISIRHRGCVIREEYKTLGGYSGMSMSFYDAARKKWHQTWMGMDGGALFIEGGIDDNGAMVLSNANTPYYKEGAPINRITWTPKEDGSVRQHWQASADGGKSWSDVFDGLYVKRIAD